MLGMLAHNVTGANAATVEPSAVVVCATIAGEMNWTPDSTALRDRIAVVAGATRGAGRGIAAALGEAGATVICTGRSTRAAWIVAIRLRPS